MLTLPAIFLPLAYHVRRVAYRCVTSSKVSCSNNKDTIWLHYSIFFNLSWFRTWVGMRSVLSQAHMLSQCSDAFPPLVLFTSRRGGKERKKKKLVFSWNWRKVICIPAFHHPSTAGKKRRKNRLCLYFKPGGTWYYIL